MKHYMGLILGSLLSASAMADTPSYNFVQAGYVNADYADLQPFDLIGFEVQASAALTEAFFTTGRFRMVDDTLSAYKLEETNWQVGIGYQMPYGKDTVFDVRVNYGDIAFDYTEPEGKFDDSASHYSVSSHARHMLAEDMEVYAGLEWQFWKKGSDQKAYRLGSMYNFSDLAVGVEYVKYSDSSAYTLFARYNF